MADNRRWRSLDVEVQCHGFPCGLLASFECSRGAGFELSCDNDCTDTNNNHHHNNNDINNSDTHIVIIIGIIIIMMITHFTIIVIISITIIITTK